MGQQSDHVEQSEHEETQQENREKKVSILVLGLLDVQLLGLMNVVGLLEVHLSADLLMLLGLLLSRFRDFEMMAHRFLELGGGDLRDAECKEATYAQEEVEVVRRRRCWRIK